MLESYRLKGCSRLSSSCEYCRFKAIKKANSKTPQLASNINKLINKTSYHTDFFFLKDKFLFSKNYR